MIVLSGVRSSWLILARTAICAAPYLRAAGFILGFHVEQPGVMNRRPPIAPGTTDEVDGVLLKNARGVAADHQQANYILSATSGADPLTARGSRPAG